MQIFTLDDPANRSALRLQVNNPALWSKAVRGNDPAFPLGAQQYMGRQLRDFLWTALSGISVISSRVVELLIENHITGWRTYEVDIVDAEGNRLPGYLGLGIVGRYTGRITFDVRESTLIYHNSPKGAPFPYFKGLCFNPSEWDGSDLCMDTFGSGWILASERMANLFKKHKVTNCSFCRIEDVELLAQESAILKGV